MSATVSGASITRARLISSQPLESGNLQGKKIALIVIGALSVLSLLATAVNAYVVGADPISFAGATGFVGFAVAFFLTKRIKSLPVVKPVNPEEERAKELLSKELADLRRTKIKLTKQVSDLTTQNSTLQKRVTDLTTQNSAPQEQVAKLEAANIAAVSRSWLEQEIEELNRGDSAKNAARRALERSQTSDNNLKPEGSDDK